MFSFFNRKNNQTDLPQWASFFNTSEYSTFIYEIEYYFKKKKIQIEISEGIINVEQNEFGLNNLGLSNVAQICKQDETKNYKEIITEHFNTLIQSNKFELEFKKISDNFEEVKKYIGVRLYNKEYISYAGQENIIAKEFTGDIYCVIVFDFPHSVSSIKREQSEKWKKSVDELFEIGKQNIREKYPITITKENFSTFNIWFAN